MKVNYFFKVFMLIALTSYSFAFGNGILNTKAITNASYSMNTLVSLEPSVTTDQLDYPPGSTAIIYGTGFQPGEEVELHVHHADGDLFGTDPENHQPQYMEFLSE